MSIEDRQLTELISRDRIEERVRALGAEITRDYSGRELMMVGVLKGSFIFMADLLRAIDLPVRCDFLGLSSYGTATESSGVVAITQDLGGPIEGCDVLVVEDIIDTGLTMQYLLENLETRKPRSVRVASLLSKPARRRVEVQMDYIGFTIEDRFVVGCGLDYAGLYRGLPYVAAVD